MADKVRNIRGNKNKAALIIILNNAYEWNIIYESLKKFHLSKWGYYTSPMTFKSL